MATVALTQEQEAIVEHLAQEIGDALTALRDCNLLGVKPGDAVRACGIPWPEFADYALEQMIVGVPS
jgi:hypothetical protein